MEQKYEDLLKNLNNKAAILQANISHNWQQYLSQYTNIMGDIDTWLECLDDSWLAIANSTEAQNRLIESNLMKEKGRKYATNRLPWLRNEALLSKNDTREAAVNKSASLIVEHATRRVDFYFMTALFFYNKPATITLIDTNRSLQYVNGASQYRTEASHSAIISNFQARKKTGEELSTGPHLLKTLNTTVELPTIVNDFDGALEGKIQEHLQSKWRKMSIQILHGVSGNADEPRKALVKFLINMLDFFQDEKTQAKYWSMNSSIENRLTYVFQCIGTFYFLWSKTCNLDSYINLFMRIDNDKIQQFQERKYIRVNRYKMLSNEIAGSPIDNHWINEFFASDLSDENKKNILREDDFTLDVLDNLLCYPETFDAAMTLLLNLVDEEYVGEIELENCHYLCHIIYRVAIAFSPLLGGISYEQRLKYLDDHLFSEEDTQQIIRSAALMRALYSCLKIVSFDETPGHFGSLIYPEDTKIEWNIPQIDNDKDDPIVEKYYVAVTKLIIRAGISPYNPYLRNDAIPLVCSYIESNLYNLLAEDTSRQIINLFLIGLPIKDWNDFESEGINVDEIIKIFKKITKNDVSMLRNDLPIDDVKIFKRRINEFYISIAINLYRKTLKELNITDIEDEKVFDWYQNFIESEDVEEISYLYNYFNGKDSWENDIKELDGLSTLSPTQAQRLANKIQKINDGVSQFYSEISQSGVHPSLNIIKAPVSPILLVSQEKNQSPLLSKNNESDNDIIILLGKSLSLVTNQSNTISTTTTTTTMTTTPTTEYKK